MRKGFKIGFKVFFVILVWVVAVVINYPTYVQRHKEEIQVPIKKEIEKAIAVKGLENKFIFVRSVFFGGAGGGGLGAPMVICSSAEQFSKLVPKEEPVYVAFEFPVIKESQGMTDSSSLKKVYWAFIENRAGLMIYEDIYSYSKYGTPWELKKYNPDTVWFYYSNIAEIIFLLIITITVGLVVGGWLTYEIITY